ncbi:hypothetical protein EC973_007091 [Apophysomyces ossiformis]|uniref:Uncharacterized protein n=1 Tax=Apophysomyces ossiformis TaxID=679940 RepID=A0A8H7ETF8_9FUNG|nr:hypothetical protein EC973_007091 [Apophysomyces ossiformis]
MLGLSFTFPIPTRHQELYRSTSDLPLEFPDGTTPIASRVYLYNGSTNWQMAVVPPLSKAIAEFNSSNSVKYGKLGRRELESVVAHPTKGVSLYFPTHGLSTEVMDGSRESTAGLSTNTVQIVLNSSSVQDILADIGKPSRIFYKEEDKMKIHSITDDGAILEKASLNSKISNDDNRSLSENEDDEKGESSYLQNSEDVYDWLDPTTVHPTDYFLNYFHLGLDILIDGALHVCKKIILHGNIPGHYDFQRYKRCPFQILFPKQEGEDYSILKLSLNKTMIGRASKSDANMLVDVESDLDENGAVVTADMKISTMQKRIPWESSNTVTVGAHNGSQLGQQKPVILTRGSSEQNPFGSTYLTGYDEGVVMEVMKNACVPTVVLF